MLLLTLLGLIFKLTLVLGDSNEKHFGWNNVDISVLVYQHVY